MQCLQNYIHTIQYYHMHMRKTGCPHGFHVLVSWPVLILAVVKFGNTFPQLVELFHFCSTGTTRKGLHTTQYGAGDATLLPSVDP